MSEKDVVSAYAKELKLASVRENAPLFAEDAMREQWGYLAFLRRLLEEEVTQRREKSKDHAHTQGRLPADDLHLYHACLHISGRQRRRIR